MLRTKAHRLSMRRVQVTVRCFIGLKQAWLSDVDHGV